jgi:hypothetical protein
MKATRSALFRDFACEMIDAVNLILLPTVLVQFRSSSYAQMKDILPVFDRIEIATEQAPGEFVVSEF